MTQQTNTDMKNLTLVDQELKEDGFEVSFTEGVDNLKETTVTEQELENFIDTHYDDEDNPYKRMEQMEDGRLILVYQIDSYDVDEWIELYINETEIVSKSVTY